MRILNGIKISSEDIHGPKISTMMSLGNLPRYYNGFPNVSKGTELKYWLK